MKEKALPFPESVGDIRRTMDESRRSPEAIGLLEAYLSSGRSEKAFAELMAGLGGLVFSSALRRTGSREMAEEVAQNVFAILARKASALRRHPSLLGWIYQTTRFEAAKAMQAERRQQRKLAALSKEPKSACEHPLADPPEWMEALPILDEVIDDLPVGDRELVLLRFFEGRKFRDIAGASGRSEAACKMHLRRVLARLSRLLSARGVTLSAAAITAALSKEFAKAAPTELLSSAPRVLAASNAMSGATVLINTIVTMSSVKATAIILCVVAFLVTGSFLWRQSEVNELRQEIASLRSSTATRARPIIRAEDLNPQFRVASTSRQRARELLDQPDRIDARSLLEGLTEAILTHDMLAQYSVFLPLAKMTSGELEDLLKEVKSHSGHSQAKEKAVEVLAALAGEQDLAQTLQRSLEAGVSTYSYAHRFHNWVIEDPEAALGWYQARVEDGSLLGDGLSDSPETILYGELLAAFAKTDVDRAIALFFEASHEDHSPLIYKLATAIAERGEEFEPHVRTFIQGLDSARDKERAVESSVWAMGRTRNSLDEAVAFLNSYEVSDPARSSTLVNLVMENGKELSIPERVAWLLEHMPQSYADRSLDDLFQRFSWDDGERLDAYIASQSDGRFRDSALSARAASLAQQRDGEGALRKALGISDASRRQDTIRRVVQRWKDFDAEAAVRGLETANLEPADYGFHQDDR